MLFHTCQKYPMWGYNKQKHLTIWQSLVTDAISFESDIPKWILCITQSNCKMIKG